MKIFLCVVALFGAAALAEERTKRQASYSFPGPRGDRSYRPQSAPAPSQYSPEEHDAEIAIRRQYQPQAPPQQYHPQGPPRAAAPQQAPPQYAPEEAPRTQSRSVSSSNSRRRAAASTSSRANKYGSAPAQSLRPTDEEEEEEDSGPDPLTLLLEDSQFTCGGKTDGYYADDSVNCQVFHYCVGGAKHSWMCPENTVFHQVHLNCVPDAQDICAQSQKFHFVNDYLYKPVDYDGPNKTARYSQRYYPEGYVVGDPLVAPQDHAPRRPAAAPQPQSYPAPAPAHRRPAPQQAPSYRPAQEERVYRTEPQPQPRPVERRPARPVETYPQAESPTYRSVAAQARGPPQSHRPVQEAPPPTYRQETPPPQYRVVPPQPAEPPQTYRVVPPQPTPPQTYRVVPPQQQAQQPPQYRPSYNSGEEAPTHYQPQARRAAVQPQSHRQPSAYAPPRQQYRAQSRAYQPQVAAGVEYDEEY